MLQVLLRRTVLHCAFRLSCASAASYRGRRRKLYQKRDPGGEYETSGIRLILNNGRARGKV